MILLRYKNEETLYNVGFDVWDTHHVHLTGNFPVKTKGFDLFNSKNIFLGEYYEYVTVYKSLETGVIFSNDGSVYVEPEPPAPPTLEEVQEMKVQEMNLAQQEIISHGLQVKLSDGKTYPFSLTTNDQISIMGSSSVVGMSIKGTPWHIADESVHCVYFSEEDMKAITQAAYLHVTYHVTYFRDLRIYIRALEEKSAVEAIQYGVMLPAEYQSEVLKDMLSAMSAQKASEWK